MKWMKCYEQLPSESDADRKGQVIIRIGNREEGYDFALMWWAELKEDSDFEWLEGGLTIEEEVRYAR